MTEEQIKQVTREMIQTTSDIPSVWADEAWQMAKRVGVISGFNEEGTDDRPQARPSREQVVYMIMKAIEYADNALVWDGSVADGFASGTGTANDPYRIETPSQLAYLAESVNRGNTFNNNFFRMENDISLNFSKDYPLDWTPIGMANRIFAGNFDGDGHSIYGLYINTDRDYQGLFGNASGVISNLTIKSGKITAGGFIGGIVGGGVSTIRNCKNHVDIEAQSADVGGIAGSALNIEGCINYGNLKGANRIGGICGNVYSPNAVLKQLINEGNVVGTRGVAGVLGRAVCETNANTAVMYLSDCINKGTVEGSEGYVGGIGGYINYTFEGENLENNGAITGNDYVGGLIGNGSIPHGQIVNGVNTAYVVGRNYVGGLVGAGVFLSDSRNKARVSGINYVGGIIGGGTEVVTNCENQAAILGKDYVGGIAGNAGTIDNCRNNGYIEGENFLGSIAGQATETIRNCKNYIDVEGQYDVGGIAGSALNIEECINYGDVRGLNRIGGICGNIYLPNAKLKKLINEGNVTAFRGAAGIVGRAVCETNSNVAVMYIVDCMNKGDIQIDEDYAGGIGGYIDYRMEGYNLENIGNISGNDYVGGLIGIQNNTYGEIQNGVNKGNVSGKDYIGGIAGTLPKLVNTYSLGNIQSTSARNNDLSGKSASIVNSYFLNNTGNNTSSHARTSTQLKQKSTYQNWDFDTIWMIDEGNDYPKLRWTLD